MHQSRVSQNLTTARTANAMSGRVIVAVQLSVPIASRHGNLDTSFFSSGVRGSYAFETVDIPEIADILLAVSMLNVYTI